MRIFLFAALLLALAAIGVQPTPTRAQGATKYTASLRDDQVHNREIIVELDSKAGSKTASAVLSSAGVKTVSTLALHHAQKSYRIVRVPAGQDYMAALRKLENDPSVVSVGPNVVKHASAINRSVSFIANDPRFLTDAATLDDALQIPGARDSQWGLIITGATTAWETTTGDPSVVVAVIDTGANFNQEDMVNRWWTNTQETPNNNVDEDGNGLIDDYRGYDFYEDDPNATDPSGEALSHGVATSSIIGAAINNNKGMAGVAGGTGSGGVRIMPLRVGTDIDIPVSAEIAAIDYAIEKGAKVISMSFGGASGGTPEEDAIDRAWQAGVLTFAAAGNDGAGNGGGDINAIDLPAGFDNCICVGATTIYDSQGVGPNTDVISETVAGYSKRGPEMDLAAPGTHIIAAMNSTSGYTTWVGQEFTGTSAATPVAAGLGALILSAHHDWDNNQALALMKSTAVDLGAAGFDNLFGYGRIDMAAALPPAPVVKLGDYNSDGSVNNTDVAFVKSHFGAKTGESNFVVKADGNSDGVIDELDVFIIARHWGE